MADVRTLRRSFAGGEITPEMFGRLDLVKFQTGLATAENFITLPHGPAINRPGTRFVREVSDSSKATRLIPFVVSDTLSYILEFGDQYIRFHSLGGTILDPAAEQTITDISPDGSITGHVFTVAGHGYSDGDAVVLNGITRGGSPVLTPQTYYIANKTTDTFNLEFYNSGSGIYLFYKHPSDTTYAGGTVNDASGVPYEISSPYVEADLFDLEYSQATGILTITHPNYAPRELTITSPSSWSLDVIDFNTPPAAVTGVAAAATVAVGVGGSSIYHSYVVTQLDSDGNESVISNVSSVQNNLYTAGNYNTVTWTTTGATFYRVYKSQAGGSGATGAAFGLIGQAVDNAGSPFFIDDNIAPDTSISPPVNQTIFASTDNYPLANAYFEQRRAFAGTNNEQQNFWATRSGSDSNFSKPFPVQDDSPIEFRIASRQANSIKHIVPLEDLLLFSGSTVWRVSSNSGDALTPTNIVVRPTAYVGASNVQPVTVGNIVLFEEVRSGHLTELKYSYDVSGYQITDASLLAAHLFDGYSLVDMGYSVKPYKILWAVRDDGTLLGMTYVPDQQVLGWHHHVTATAGGDSSFESVVVVPEPGDADGVYVIVNRTINGSTVRYIEKLELGRFDTLEDAFYVDCGLTYDGNGTLATTFSNLDHLEGEEVAILADGAVITGKTVSGGAVTISNAADVVHIGLAITADFKTLPLEYEAAGSGQGVEKNITKAHLRVYQSSSIFAGPTFDNLREFKQRTDEDYGDPPALYTGVASVLTDPRWDVDGQLCLRQTKPLPVTIVSLSLEVAIGDY